MLSFRIDEKFIHNDRISSSVVGYLSDNGEAIKKGVTLQSILIGMNGEYCISYAHTIAYLRHSKRPIIIRFRRNN